MEGFNKIISFILGLIVVVFLLAIISGRLNMGKNFFSWVGPGGKTSPAPTQAPSPKLTPTQKITPSVGKENYPFGKDDKNYHVYGVASIPSTGAPTILLPILLSSFFGGLYLKKTGKK